MLSEINSTDTFAFQLCMEYSPEIWLYEINGSEKSDKAMKNFPVSDYSKSVLFCFSFRKETSKRTYGKCFKHHNKYYNKIWTSKFRSISFCISWRKLCLSSPWYPCPYPLSCHVLEVVPGDTPWFTYLKSKSILFFHFTTLLNMTNTSHHLSEQWNVLLYGVAEIKSLDSTAI